MGDVIKRTLKNGRIAYYARYTEADGKRTTRATRARTMRKARDVLLAIEENIVRARVGLPTIGEAASARSLFLGVNNHRIGYAHVSKAGYLRPQIVMCPCGCGDVVSLRNIAWCSAYASRVYFEVVREDGQPVSVFQARLALRRAERFTNEQSKRHQEVGNGRARTAEKRRVVSACRAG